MLTPTQQKLLIYITKRLEQGESSPSYNEMKDALGLKVTSGIRRKVLGLEERGFIRRQPGRSRSIEILRQPYEIGATSCASCCFHPTPLSVQQRKLLRYILGRLEQGGVSPTFAEMMDALGVGSKSTIHRLILGLEESGFIRRLSNRYRALEILHQPHVRGPAPCGTCIYRPERLRPRSAVALLDRGGDCLNPRYPTTSATDIG